MTWAYQKRIWYLQVKFIFFEFRKVMVWHLCPHIRFSAFRQPCLKGQYYLNGGAGTFSSPFLPIKIDQFLSKEVVSIMTWFDFPGKWGCSVFFATCFAFLASACFCIRSGRPFMIKVVCTKMTRLLRHGTQKVTKPSQHQHGRVNSYFFIGLLVSEYCSSGRWRILVSCGWRNSEFHYCKGRSFYGLLGY